MSESACLYIVATPIGHLGDITYRAVEVLQQVDHILVEDTRQTRKLLQFYHIDKPLIPLHKFNEQQSINKILGLLQAGEQLALVSDAGTPLIHDPGQVLVQAVVNAGFQLIPIPGVSAVTTALSVAGLTSDQFIFAGFIPTKTGERQRFLDALANSDKALVFFESPHRIIASLQAMLDAFGPERPAMIGREMTKLFETYQHGTLAELNDFVANDSNQQKGEFVIVVGEMVAEKDDDIDEDTLKILRILQAELSHKQAVNLTAKITGIRKNRLYKLVVDAP